MMRRTSNRRAALADSFSVSVAVPSSGLPPARRSPRAGLLRLLERPRPSGADALWLIGSSTGGAAGYGRAPRSSDAPSPERDVEDDREDQRPGAEHDGRAVPRLVPG